MNCPYCKKSNPHGLLLCEYCGKPLIEFTRYHTQELARAGTGPLNFPSPTLGTGSLHSASYVTLDLLDAERKIYLKTEGHMVIGRADQALSWTPNIDLTPYGAAEKGVSRKHADLFFEADQVFLLELGSANGTRLNGIMVRTGTAQQVHNGDTIQLGNLRMRIYFDFNDR